jgi:hypothetical protein
MALPLSRLLLLILIFRVSAFGYSLFRFSIDFLLALSRAHNLLERRVWFRRFFYSRGGHTRLMLKPYSMDE